MMRLFALFACMTGFLLAQNLLYNGDFKAADQSKLPGWRRAIGWSGKSDYSWADGIAKIVHPEDDKGAGAFIGDGVPVEEGKSYAFAVEARGTDVEHADLALHWLDAKGNKLGYELVQRERGTFDWKRLKGVFTAPPGAAKASLLLVVGSGGTIEFRKAFMQQGTRFEPIPDDGNLLANPDFTNVKDGVPVDWNPATGWSGKSDYALVDSTLVIRRSEATDGAGAFITPKTPLAGTPFVQVGVDIKATGLSGKARIMVQFCDAKGRGGLSVPVGQLEKNSDWTSFSKTLQVPEDARSIVVFLILNGRGEAHFRKPFVSVKLPPLPDNRDSEPFILNGSFEGADFNDGFIDCFTLRKGEAKRTAKAFHGNHALRLAPETEVVYGDGVAVPIAVAAGEKLELSLAALGRGLAKAQLEFVGNDGKAVEMASLDVAGAEDLWRQGRKDIQVPARAIGARLMLLNGGDAPVTVDALHLGMKPFDAGGSLAVPVVDIPHDDETAAAFPPSTVKERNGVPTWHIDGKPMTGAMFTMSRVKQDMSKSWYGYVRKTMRLGKFPVTLLEVSLSSHPRNTKYTMEQALEAIDFQVKTCLAEVPDEKFILWLALEPCQDFADEYPQELLVNEQTELPFADDVPPYSYGSEVWGRLCARRVAELLREVARKPYASHIVGISPGMGRYGENNWGHAGVVGGATPQDFSPAMQNFFRKWLFREYGGDVRAFAKAWNQQGRFNFTNAQTPVSQVRLHRSMGSFYDPKTDRQTLDYLRCESFAILHRVLQQCEAAKNATDGRMFTFTQFGYFTSWMYHRDFATALNSPFLDAMGPAPAYINRGPGDDIQDHAPAASIRAHGKVWLFQADVRTHLADYHNWSYGRTKDEEESVGVFLRDLGHYMATGTYPYYMSFEQWYDSPKMWDVVSRFQEYMELAARFRQRSAAEVAVVMDTDSLCLGFDYSYVTRIMPVQQSSIEYNRTFEWHHLGTPYDFFMLDDLLNSKELQRYKVVIFAANSVVSDAQRKLIDERLKRDGRTLVWMYAPGIVAKKGTSMDFDVRHASDLTGFKLSRDDSRADLSIRLSDGRVFGRFTTDIYGGFTMPHNPKKVRRESFHPSFNVVPEDGVEVFGTYENDGAPAAAIRRHESWTDVFWGSTALNKEVLLPILDKADVHLYTDAPAVVYANGNFLVVHSPVEGSRTVRLPGKAQCIYDLYARRELAQDADQVQVTLPKNGTALLYFGDRKALEDAQETVADAIGTRMAANTARLAEFAHELTRKPPKGRQADTNEMYRPDAEGFIRHWLFLAPLPNYEREGIATDFLGGEAAAKPKAGDAMEILFDATQEQRAKESRSWFDGERKKETMRIQWKPMQFSTGILKALYDELPVADLPFSDNIVYYVFCNVVSPEERKVILAVGSDDNEKCWLNGELVTQCNFASRGCKPDSETALVTLKAGRNTLLLKVSQGGGGVGHAVRFLDAESNLPMTNLRISLK